MGNSAQGVPHESPPGASTEPLVPANDALEAPAVSGEALGEACVSSQLPVSTGVQRRTARASRSSHCTSYQPDSATARAASPRAATQQRSPNGTMLGFLRGALRSGAQWAWPQQWAHVARTRPRQSRSAQGSADSSVSGGSADSGIRALSSAAAQPLGAGLLRLGARGSGGAPSEEDCRRERESWCKVVAAVERLERRFTSGRTSSGSRGVHAYSLTHSSGTWTPRIAPRTLQPKMKVTGQTPKSTETSTLTCMAQRHHHLHLTLAVSTT